MNQEHFTFHLQYKHSGRLDNRKYHDQELSHPKNPKRCDPIHSLGARGPRMCRPSANAGNARHMREQPLVPRIPHSNNSIENATPWGNAICYCNSKTVRFDLPDYQELVIGQVKSDS